MRIRPATLADAAALADLATQLGYPSDEERVRSRLSLLDDLERTVLIAATPAGITGFIDVHLQRVVEDDPYAEVGGLAVRDDARGAGIGTALVEAAADWGRAHGVAVLWIRANLAREGVHEFYPAIGCRRVKDQRVYELRL